MFVRRFERPSAFLAAGEEPLLATDAAANNLLFGIARLLDDGAVQPGTYLALAMASADRPVAAALRTPPRRLVVSPGPAAAFVEDLAAVELPGVVGPRRAAAEFAARWHEVTGAVVALEQTHLLYQLGEPVSPPAIPGEMRRATAADLDVVSRWIDGFSADTGVDGDDPRPASEVASLYIAAGRAYLWDDGEPRALAGCTGPSAGLTRIQLVYTPPDLRGRGYAAALVHALGRELTRRGRGPVTLYADRANATSNRLYRRLGYRAVGGNAVYRFDRARVGPASNLPLP